ncbi:MAG: PQQ-dependent sugar dehydrogenase [Alphaproteobacteria bacterium]|nr:PQQ-dependent sugar dehydrogenase [Alphaproteobacteria bacterium]
MKFAKFAVALALASTAASAQVNDGDQKPEAALPFNMAPVATFNLPWRMAFLPDGRMLVTEKVGPIWLVTPQGLKRPVLNYPAALYGGQGGMLGIYVSPHYATDNTVYLTYSEPGTMGGISGSSLALAKAKLVLNDSGTPATASLDNLQVIWRDGARGRGGQFGAAVAFAPDGNSLFLTVGDRQRFTPAQDPNQPLGKILHLTLDGKPAADNPYAGKTGAKSVGIINPPSDTEAAKTAPTVYTYTFPGQNMTPSEVWTTGHRTPYGMAFAPDGRLWEMEHGPKGGDELNLIEKGKNYGWPLVSYSTNYNGVPIPSPDSRTDLTKPVIYWTPVIAPGNITFYKGIAFPQWNGSILLGGMATMTLNRVAVDGAMAKPAERWSIGHRIRDVQVAPDGTVWLLEDSTTGGLWHVTPK